MTETLRQVKNNQNETTPIDKYNSYVTSTSKDHEDPQLATTKGRDSNSVVAITVEISQARGDVSTLTGRSKGGSLTLDSCKQWWEAHTHKTVESVLKKVIPLQWIHGFSSHSLTNSILEPFLTQMEPHVPLSINITPELSIQEFIDIAFAKYIIPKFNEWRYKIQSSMMKNMLN